MRLRPADKILSEWTRRFLGNESPREASADGRMPWRWSTWSEAHRVVTQRARRRWKGNE
jgi:hypothetical protein